MITPPLHERSPYAVENLSDEPFALGSGPSCEYESADLGDVPLEDTRENVDVGISPDMASTRTSWGSARDKPVKPLLDEVQALRVIAQLRFDGISQVDWNVEKGLLE